MSRNDKEIIAQVYARLILGAEHDVPMDRDSCRAAALKLGLIFSRNDCIETPERGPVAETPERRNERRNEIPGMPDE